MSNQSPHNLVFASHNEGKFNEMQLLFKDTPIEISFLKALGAPDIPETGLSFHENALIKARAAAKHTGKPAFGDDSGLCIHAFNNEPGIYSARYLGDYTSYHDKMQQIIDNMNGIDNRDADFVCVIAYVKHADDQWPRFYEGVWKGRIHDKMEGTYGFGYEPFFVDSASNRCAGTMTPSEKLLYSHRRQAINKFIKDLIEPSL